MFNHINKYYNDLKTCMNENKACSLPIECSIDSNSGLFYYVDHNNQTTSWSYCNSNSSQRNNKIDFSALPFGWDILPVFENVNIDQFTPAIKSKCDQKNFSFDNIVDDIRDTKLRIFHLKQQLDTCNISKIGLVDRELKLQLPFMETREQCQVKSIETQNHSKNVQISVKNLESPKKDTFQHKNSNNSRLSKVEYESYTSNDSGFMDNSELINGPSNSCSCTFEINKLDDKYFIINHILLKRVGKLIPLKLITQFKWYLAFYIEKPAKSSNRTQSNIHSNKLRKDILFNYPIDFIQFPELEQVVIPKDSLLSDHSDYQKTIISVEITMVTSNHDVFTYAYGSSKLTNLSRFENNDDCNSKYCSDNNNNNHNNNYYNNTKHYNQSNSSHSSISSCKTTNEPLSVRINLEKTSTIQQHNSKDFDQVNIQRLLTNFYKTSHYYLNDGPNYKDGLLLDSSIINKNTSSKIASHAAWSPH